MEAMTQEDCIFHNAWNYNPNTLEVLMQRQSEWSYMSTLLHLHYTSVLGEIPKWRGKIDITLKPGGEASKAWWNVLQHFHNISDEVSLIFSFSLNSLWHSSWVILATQRISPLKCLKFEAIWSCVPSHATMMTKMLHLRSPLTFGNDFLFSFGFTPKVLLATTGISILGFYTLYFSTFLADTNLTSFLGSLLEFPSPVYPRPILSVEDFWEESTLSNFLLEMRSTLTFAWMISSSRTWFSSRHSTILPSTLQLHILCPWVAQVWTYALLQFSSFSWLHS